MPAQHGEADPSAHRWSTLTAGRIWTTYVFLAVWMATSCNPGIGAAADSLADAPLDAVRGGRQVMSSIAPTLPSRRHSLSLLRPVE